MPAPRRKRLPTDFFDRLLSNQTDDQINDLLTSLVDEQIAPVPEAPPEEFAAVQPAAPKKRAKDFHRDKIEDSIITRDESLDEEAGPAGEEIRNDDLIPRSARMQAQGVQTRPKPEPQPAPAVPTPVAPKPAAPKPAAPIPVTPPPAEPLPPSKPLPGLEDLFVPPELLSEPSEAEPSEPDHGMPSFDLTQPAPPISEPPSLVARIVSTPPPGVHGAPAREAAPPTPPPVPAASPAPERPPEPVAPKPVLATHEDLRRARRKARWKKTGRLPKPPKLAVATPSISFAPRQPSSMDLILDLKEPRHLSFKLGRLSRIALLFLLPAFIGFSLFSWYPMLKGLFISFLHYSPTGTSSFIGAANYIRAFQDEMFWRTLAHAGWFCLLVLALGFWVPILASVFLNELKWGKGILKFMFFLPFLMPTVPAAILWQWIMDQGFGLLNAVLAVLGVAQPHIGWLTDPKLAMLSIAMLYIWKNTGWAILIYSAALTNVDETLYEEAELDGATIWDRFWLVTLPGIRTVVGVMLIITVINTLQIFTEVYILTQGGPMHATEVITSYIYKQAFFYMDIGYASALSMLLLLLLLGITLFRLKRLNPEGE